MIPWLFLLPCIGNIVTSQEFKLKPFNENQNEGYVELKWNNVTGIMSLADRMFDDATARMLCQTMGFGLVGFSTTSLTEFNLTDEVITWNDLIQCSGLESEISQCFIGASLTIESPVTSLNRGWTRLHCFDFEVQDIRLYGGMYPHSGRFEVKVGNRWGVVVRVGNNPYTWVGEGDRFCPLFGYNARMNGWTLSYDLEIADISLPITDIWMSVLSCDSGVTNIDDCYFRKGNVYGNPWKPYTFRCETLQLLGAAPNAGILETGLNWRSHVICGSSDFNAGAANLTCTHLGHKMVGSVTAVHRSPDDTHDVFNGIINCDGSESSLEMCELVEQTGECNGTVLYIECLDDPIDIIPIGNKSNIGVLKFSYFNTVYTMHVEDISNTTAMTLCSLLGHGFSGFSEYMEEKPDHVILTPLKSLECNGNETNIAQCHKSTYPPLTCGLCRAPPQPTYGYIVLYCDECSPGYYGKYCTLCTCNNRSSGPCDIETGECPCIDGWSGSSCEIDVNECLTSTVCPNNTKCINMPGDFRCEGCVTGYTMDNGICQTMIPQEKTEPNSSFLIIIMAAVIGGLLLISIIAIICACTYRKKAKKATPASSRTLERKKRGNAYSESQTRQAEDYDTIGDIPHHSGSVAANIVGSRTDQYVTSSEEIKSQPTGRIKPPGRLNEVQRPSHFQKDALYKGQKQRAKRRGIENADRKDYENPYDGRIRREVDDYLEPVNTGNNRNRTPKSNNTGNNSLPTDGLDYVQFGENNTSTYQELRIDNSREHEYDKMKI